MKKRIISFLLVMALVLSMAPAIELEALAASNLEYIENESGKGEEFELLGYGFNALGNRELDYTTMKLKPMLNYDAIEALEVSGRITSSTATYATSAQEMMYEFGIDYGNKSSATVPLEVLKIGFKSKFDASLNISEKALVDSRLYYYTNETIFRKYAVNIYDAGSAGILSTQFLRAIDTLNNSINDGTIAAFFEMWGTHMLTSYNSGAFLEYVAYAYSFSEESKLSAEITSEMELSANIMDVSRVDNIHLKLDTIQNTDTLKVQTAWLAYGGDSEKSPSELAQDLTKTQASIDEWTSSLSDDSGVMIPSSTKWMPIWELIPAEYADLKAALQDYYLRQANGVNAAFFSKFTTYSDIKGTTEVFYHSPTGHIFPVTYRSEMSVAPGAKFNVVNLDADLSNVKFQISGPATVEDGVATVDAGATSGTITVKIVDLDGNQIGSAKTFKVVKEGAGLFAGGYGDAERPYLISNATHFSNIRNASSKQFLLIDDIVYSSTTTPISDFTGILDGNGYTLSGWKYTQSTSGEVGIFRTNHGTIKNLNITNSSILNQDGAYGIEILGMVCGVNYGIIENISVTNCSLHGDMGRSDEYANSEVYAGGVCGVNDGTVRKCVANNNTINTYCGSGKREGHAICVAGGITGCSIKGSIEDAYAHSNKMNVTAEGNKRGWYTGSDATAYAGGIVGYVLYLEEEGTIRRAIAYENEFAVSASGGESNARTVAPLFWGYALEENTIVEKCYTTEKSGGNAAVLIGSGVWIPEEVYTTTTPVNVSNLDTFASNGWIQKSVGYLGIAQSTELSVNAQDAQTTYFVGEPLNLRGLLVEAVKNDAAESRIEITGGYRVSGYDPNTPGTQTITVSYGKISGTYEVTVKEPEVCEIIIAETPKKTIYYTGDTLETAGLRVMAKYTDGTAKSFSEADVTVADVDMSIVGDEVLVMVTYGDCSTTFTISIFEKECAHDGTLNSVQTLPTCTEGGYTTYTCTKCGHSYVDDYVDALGHNYGELVTPPTCFEQGYTTYTCINCGDNYVGLPVVPSHNYETKVVAPTCTEQGYTEYMCTECGHSYVDDYVDALGHSEETIPGKAATCTETGLTEGKKCSVCGEILLAQEVIAALGHSYESVVTAPTYTSQGYTTHTCTACGDSYVDSYTDPLEPAERVGVTISQVTAQKGDTVTVIVRVEENVSIKSAAINFQYDSGVLEFVKAKWNISGILTNVDEEKQNAVFLSATPVDVTGNLLTFTFKVKDDAPAGDSAITCQIKLTNADNDPIGADVTQGGVTVVEHNYEAVVTAPTCTAQGYTTYTCTTCGDSYVDDYVDALGHTEEILPGKDATCTETGLTEGKRCTICSEILVVQEEITALGHSEEILPGKDATCTETGLTEGKKCAVCGEILVAQEEIAALGHSYETVITEPTCTEQGYTTYTCACGHSYVDDYVDALGHTEEILPGKAATCIETGLTEGKKCSVCGEILLAQEVIPATGHSYETVVTAPTCTEQGYTTYTCACGDSYVDDYVDALGHSEETIPGKAATCTESGLTEGKKCSVCGEILLAQEVIAALGHSYETVITEPTCTEQGYTTYTCACGHSYVDDYVNALGHTEEILPSKDATCTETGLTEGKKCSVCGEILLAQEVIAALGHSYESVVTEPTYTSQGYTTHTCVNCGDSYVDNYTAPLVPETDVKVTVGTVSGNAGDTVEVYLTLEKAPALKILAISQIVYDTEHLTFVSGQWLRDDSFTDTFSKKNMNGLQLFEENTDVNGEIFKLTFTINEDAPAGEYAVSCVITAKQTDENGDDLDVLIAMESGKIVVKDYLLGDVDGNEKITTDDAIYLLYNIMFGDGDYPVNQKCDFDGNGKVNTDDAIYLLYHIMFGEEDYPLHG